MRIIINGFMGGLGSAIVRLAVEAGAVIAAGVDKRADVNAETSKQHTAKQEGAVTQFPVFNDISCCAVPADVIIECAAAGAISGVMAYAGDRNLPVVICTTGLTAEDEESIISVSKKIPILKSANMSIGVNIVKELVKNMAAIITENFFDNEFDIEIVEKHHNKKRDAPSGTALMLAEAINTASGGKYEYTYGRSGGKGRSANELGIHSVRGGTIYGEHGIIFAGRDEVIEISHTALSRDIFARGALRAAKYLTEGNAPGPGIYGMEKLSVMSK